MNFESLGKSSGAISIDLSSSDLKIAVGNYNRKTGLVLLEKVGIVPLESDVLNDGIIADRFSMVMAVKHALARLGIRSKSCIITSEGSFMHTRDIEVPKVKGSQLSDMVKYEVIGQGNNKDMIIDYFIYGTTKSESGEGDFLKIRATAIPRENAVEFRELIDDLNLDPYAMDVNPNCIRKLFSSGIINGNVNIAQSTLLLIELEGKTTTVSILDKGFPILTRRLQFGHDPIRKVAESIRKLQGGGETQSSLAKRLNITKSDSESSIPLEEIDVWHESVSDTAALQSASNQYFKNLVDAVSRTAQFAISKFRIDSISTCFLYGSGSSYKKIDKELSRQLGTQVEVLNTLSTVAGPKDFVLPQFINCAGALIRED